MKFIFQAGAFTGAPLYPSEVDTLVTVTDSETGLTVDLWEARDGLVEMSNPFPLTEEGVIRFYTDPGRYDITIEKAGEEETWPDVVIIDPDAVGGGGVESVNGQTGVVTLGIEDIPGLDAAIDDLQSAIDDDYITGEATVRSTDYTLSADLHNVRRDCSGDVTITIPKEAVTNLSLPDNRVYMHHVKHNGGGTLIFQGVDGDVTVNVMAGAALSMSEAGQICTIEKSTITANTWFVYGSLDAA